MLRGWPWLVVAMPLMVACGDDAETLDGSQACDRDVDGDGYLATACGGDDCDDRMASVNPGALERCDLIDQDCDGRVDEGVLSEGFEDRDGDRHGDPNNPRMGCAFDGALASSMADCADDDRRHHREMVEICDGRDNDCDGSVDEGPFTVSWYADDDGDGFGDPHGTVRASCEPLEGFSMLPYDCDDESSARSPVAPEVCNGLDDDCDGYADFLLAEGDTEDDDHDGVADDKCPGDVGRDCDDRDPFTRPGAPELCDGVDNDCDGTVDEGATELAWYVDDDRDRYGDASVEPTMSCERVFGWALEGGDCAVADPAVNPGAPERCNGADDDCDGIADEGAATIATYADADGDEFGAGMPLARCTVEGLRSPFAGDCDDRHPNRRPNAPELCDGADNDCDGAIDEGAGSDLVITYDDADGDGFGDEGTFELGVASCGPSGLRGLVTIGGDCDDGDPNRFPRAMEVCDGVDQDCDGDIDEVGIAVTVLQYPDGDGDGFGTGAGVSGCEPLAGHALRPGDCDDSNAAVRPGATEECNGVDDDCDGSMDEAPAGVIGCFVATDVSLPVCARGACR